MATLSPEGQSPSRAVSLGPSMPDLLAWAGFEGGSQGKGKWQRRQRSPT